MAFGTTSSHGKAPSSSPPSKSVPPKQIRSERPRRGKIAAHWEEWQIHEQPLGLSPSQRAFADTFFRGDNCLLSGEAGSGKSFLVNALISFALGKGLNVAVTGSTGVGALNIGGQTLHSFCGLGLGDDPVEQIITKVLKNRKVKDRLRAMDVLFIDEVSMIKGDLLDKVNALLKSIRHCYDPMGGVQVVFIGDFLQLLPVFRGDEQQVLAFESASWKEADIQTVVLKEQMRQKDDKVLTGVLNDLRVGDTDSLHLLDSRVGATFPADGIEPVRILCKNVDVDSYNKQKLAQIAAPSKVYKARDTGQSYHTEAFNRNCPAPETLELKVGALVTLLVNTDVKKGYVNGSVGVVKAFSTQGVVVKFRRGELVVTHNEWEMKEQEVGVDGKLKSKVVATRSQIPLKLAWASTVHRAQGQTLDRAVVDMSEAFTYAMVYVALSRVRDMESLSLVAKVSKNAVRVNTTCVRFYRDIEDGKDPVAEALRDGDDESWGGL